MKEKWERLMAMKGAPWIVLLFCCLLALLLAGGDSLESSGMTAEESRMAATLSQIAGVGEAQVSIYYAETGSSFGQQARMPAGAVIVARGAGDLQVRLRLFRAAETLLGLPPARVEVFSMEEGK